MKSIKLPSWINRALGVENRAAPPHVFAMSEGGLFYARFATQGKDKKIRVLEETHQTEIPDTLLGSGPVGGPIRDQVAFEVLVAEFVGGLATPVEEASLVLPDTWARLVFLEVAEIPKAERGREEMLLWKLKQEVPFRVEDLRVRGVEVSPLQDQLEPQRLLVGFGAEQLFSGIERAFSKVGVGIGHIANQSMSFAEAAASGKGGEAFLWGAKDGYSLVVLEGGEPVLFRSKKLGENLADEVVSGMIERELRLTLGFLEKRRPGVALKSVVVAAEDAGDFWIGAAQRGVARRNADEVELSIVPVSTALQGRVEFGQAVLTGDQLVALFGAAQRLVA